MNYTSRIFIFLVITLVLTTLTLGITLPQFSGEMIDDDQDCYEDGCIGPGVNVFFYINVTDTNGTVFLEINGENVSAEYQGDNLYAAGYNFCDPGDHTYQWHSFGGDLEESHSTSSSGSIHVVDNWGITPPFCDGIVEAPVFDSEGYLFFMGPEDNGGTLEFSGTGVFKIEVPKTNGTVFLMLNGTKVFATNDSNIFTANFEFTGPGRYVYQWYGYELGTESLFHSINEYYYDVGFKKFNGKINGKGVIPNNENCTVTVSLFNPGDEGCEYFLYRDNELLPSLSDNVNLTGGFHNYILNSSGCTNYLADPEIYVLHVYSEKTFSYFGDNTNTLTNSGIGTFRVYVSTTNGTVFLEIDGKNVTAKKTSNSLYEVNYSFNKFGTYPYTWYSYSYLSGVGLEKSIQRVYVISYSSNLVGDVTHSSSRGDSQVIDATKRKYFEQQFKDIEGGKTLGVKIPKEYSLHVKRLDLVFNEDVSISEVIIEEFENKPNEVKAILNPYQYLKIEVNQEGANQLDGAILELSVSKTNSQGINKSNAIASRWVDEGWENYKLQYLNEDSENYYYSLTVPGFSYWVISRESTSTEDPLELSKKENFGEKILGRDFVSNENLDWIKVITPLVIIFLIVTMFLSYIKLKRLVIDRKARKEGTWRKIN